MKVVQFLKIMVVVTFMAVIYIHLQVKIYSLAYQGKSREQKLEKLAESNVLVKNDILRLKSSDHIGRKLLSQEKEYAFAGRNRVVEVEEKGRSWNEALVSSKGGAFFDRFMTLAFAPAAPAIGK